MRSLVEKARRSNLPITETHDVDAPEAFTVFGVFGEVSQVDAVTGELSLL